MFFTAEPPKTRLQIERERRRMSQRQLGRNAECDGSLICRAEARQRGLGGRTRRRIAAVLQLRPDELLLPPREPNV